jgi:hypothetical protein
MSEFDCAQTLSPPPDRRARTFVLHVGEMLLVMLAGMAVLGGVTEGVLAMLGSSLSNASVAVHASVMGFNMTAPMIWWMRRRGHTARQTAEMAGSMIVPTLLAIGLYSAEVVPGSAVPAIQHVVMIPAMVGVMLARYDHYAQ